jgi:3-oxoacyl-[acyl-carrier-protein] synthase-3
MAGLNAHIVGWGKYLPGKPVTNADLAKTAAIDSEWVEERLGIQARHYAEPKQASADMGTRAARAALERAQLSPIQLELIIAATNTPDYLFPATACLIQDALGAQRAGAFDLAAGCSAFLYALVTADRFIRSGAYRHILVVGVETVSRILPFHDRICAYFGDGAGAVVLSAGEQAGGLMSFALSADGSGGDLLALPGGGSMHPPSQVLEQGLQYGKMDGRGVYRYGLRSMVRLGQQALLKARLKVEDVDLFIPHQTNIQLIQQTARRLQIPDEKVFVNVARYANISSAAIPVSLCDALAAGRLRPGDRVLMTAFGAGLASAGVVWQWSEPAPAKPMSLFKRFWLAVWDAQAAFRSRLFRLEHRIDTLEPLQEEEPDGKTE